jgi:outer membrane lipoprotein LolB
MKNRLLSLVLCIGTLAALAGCATSPARPPAQDIQAAWAARQQQLAPLRSWELRGRVALRARDQGWHATVVWVRRQEHNEIDLSGPLGSGHLRLSQDPTGAQLRDSSNHVLRARDAETLLQRATGWDFPVDGLNYWVLGLPAPGEPETQRLDPWGRLKALRQSGWDIEFLAYDNAGALELPSKLFLRREKLAAADPGDTLEVRLVVDQWVLR